MHYFAYLDCSSRSEGVICSDMLNLSDDSCLGARNDMLMNGRKDSRCQCSIVDDGSMIFNLL